MGVISNLIEIAKLKKQTKLLDDDIQHLSDDIVATMPVSIEEINTDNFNLTSGATPQHIAEYVIPEDGYYSITGHVTLSYLANAVGMRFAQMGNKSVQTNIDTATMVRLPISLMGFYEKDTVVYISAAQTSGQTLTTNARYSGYYIPYLKEED